MQFLYPRKISIISGSFPVFMFVALSVDQQIDRKLGYGAIGPEIGDLFNKSSLL